MRRGLSSIDHRERPGLPGARAHPGDRVDRAQHVRDVRKSHDARPAGDKPLERPEVERAVIPEGNGLQHGTSVPRRQLPRNDVRVVFELGDEHLVAGPQRAPDRLGQKAEAVGRPAREDDLLAVLGADEPLDTVARGLVELRGLLAERVDGAVDVGVAPRVVLAHRLDHRPRPLARRGRVEVDERVAVDNPLEDREVRARPLVESHRLPFNAAASTERGSVTQRIRVGRMSAWSTASTSAASTVRASTRDRPTTSSATGRLSTCGPARTRGRARSNVVAWENSPHVGIPSTGRPSHMASHRRLPGWAGAPWRSMRAPSSVSPPNTGSSGSSALAPATIRTSAPARWSAVSSSAITRGAPPANRTGRRRLPNHSAFCWSAVSKRARCVASRRSWATAPSVAGRKPRTVTSPPAPRAVVSTVRIVFSPMTSGVTLHLATVSPDSTGFPSNRVNTDTPSSAFASASGPRRIVRSPRRVAASVHCPPP